MKSVYLESSFISYITVRPSKDVVISARQAITIEWWDDYRETFEAYISELVLEEIGSGDPSAAQRKLLIVQDIPILETTKSATKLARRLLSKKAVPESCIEDALHRNDSLTS